MEIQTIQTTIQAREHQQEDLDQTSPIIGCPICFCDSSEIENPLTLDCAHKFCQDCFKEYLTTQISNLKILKIPCPQEKCSSSVSEKLLQQILEPEIFEKYQQLVLQKINIQKGNKICPKAGCSKFITPNKDSPYSKCTCESLVCNSCNNFWHEGKTCYEAMDREFEIYARENELKMCLMCKTMVARVEGCTHITCPICDYEWCWICGCEYTYDHEVKCAKDWNPLPPQRIRDVQVYQSQNCFGKALRTLQVIIVFILLFPIKTLFFPFFLDDLRASLFHQTRKEKFFFLTFLSVLNAFYLGLELGILYLLLAFKNGKVVFTILEIFLCTVPWIVRGILFVRHKQILRWHSPNTQVFAYTGTARPEVRVQAQPIPSTNKNEDPKPEHVEIEVVNLDELTPTTQRKESNSLLDLESLRAQEYNVVQMVW